MKTAAILLALSMMGIAGQAVAQTANEISPNNTKQFYDQMDREGRGGRGQN